MKQLPFKHLTDAVTEYDVVVFDLWGVIVEGGIAYPGVIDALNDLMKKKDVMFLTNAPRPASIIEKRLMNWGINSVDKDQIITSGDVADTLIKEHINSKKDLPKIFHLGEENNKDILSNVDHVLTDDIENADIMLLSLEMDESEDINAYDDLLEKAARIPDLPVICSNPDTKIPKHGMWRYCSGYFAAKIDAIDKRVIYSGKPTKLIFTEIFKRKPDISKNRILMVGDTFETDILGANNSDIHSTLVLSGNSKQIHGEYSSMEQKLESLSVYSNKVDIVPNFVTKIA